jgi:hypothetical protein
MKIRLIHCLLLAFCLLPALAGAKDQTCTDGVNCLCDRISKSGDPSFTPGVLFCEDFEDPKLNNGSNYQRGVDGPADGWADKYGPGNQTCIDPTQPSGIGTRDEGEEGRQSFSCIDVVQENSCEVGNDCVFDGVSSLAFRLRPGIGAGIMGVAYFSPTNVRNFGFTYAVKLSSNYVGPHDPGSNGPANKTNEWGQSMSCILGCSTFNAGATSWPFAAGMKAFGSNPGGTVVRGRGEWDGDSGYRFAPTQADYDFNRDWGKGNWGCFQMQWTGWGTSNATAKYWFNGKEIYNMQNFNMASLGGEASGIRSFVWNAYYNGADGTGSGYTGSSLAYRLEDNLVVTSGVPASCAAIGLTGAPTPPASPPPAEPPPPTGGTLGTPGRPYFVP